MANTIQFPKLRGRIREMYGTQSNFAKVIKRNPSTVSAKLCKKVDFEYSEVKAWCVALNIPEQEMHLFF